MICIFCPGVVGEFVGQFVNRVECHVIEPVSRNAAAGRRHPDRPQT